MAYEFTSAGSQNLSATSTILKSQSKITFVGWVWRNASATLQIVGPAKTLDNCFYIGSGTDNQAYFAIASGSLTYGQVAAPAASNWVHIAMIFDGTQTGNSNRLKGFFDGAAQTLSFSGTIPSSSSSNVDIETFTINRLQANSSFGNGRYAEIGVWHEALTAAEIASLSKGMTCDKVRPESLVFYAPLVRDLQDLSGGLTITNNNTATVATHPRVYA